MSHGIIFLAGHKQNTEVNKQMFHRGKIILIYQYMK